MKQAIKSAFSGILGVVALAALLALPAFFQGCMSIEVEDYGDEVVRDAAGNPVCDTNGVVQTVHKGQKWDYNKNMVDQVYEDFNLVRKPGNDINLNVKNYKDAVSPELNKVVETSFKGAAELAAKVGAAIATSGGSVAGEAGYTLLKNAIAKYISKGGSAENATITCKDGNCTISDGTVTETCTDCIYTE